MKRLAIVLVLASITGCASLTKGGARGPVIQRTGEQPAEPSAPGELDARPELGQR